MTECVYIIDTNVVIAGLISSDRKSPTVRILDFMLSGSIVFVLSPALLQEYNAVLLRPKIVKRHQLTDAELEQLLSEIVANAIWREPIEKYPAPDIGDEHISSLLLQTEDTALITGDQLLLDNPPSDKSVMSPARYFECLYKL